MGIFSGGAVVLNPPADRVIGPDDELIAVAADDSEEPPDVALALLVGHLTVDLDDVARLQLKWSVDGDRRRHQPNFLWSET